ncbi:radical SAM protein [Desulfovibrio sp. JY]|nr:radical SAM protein [Desulfovibrio sp. JY]
MECGFCERRCRLGPEGYGYCRMYRAGETGVEERFPDRWCATAVSRVETVPFYHAWPGARCLIIGTAGCNFECRYCSNAEVVKVDPAGLTDIMLELSPKALVDKARKHGCHAIVFSVNEPTVSLPSLEQVAREARAVGMPMGCLTNGYATVEATERLAKVFSFVNVSLKGLSPEFCQEFLGVPDAGPILRNIAALARKVHVEVTTPVIEGTNDHELDAMAAFLADIRRDIPWHVFRLLPEYKMQREDYPSIEAISARIEDCGRRLDYVYFHNFIGSRWVNTHCPSCGTVVIERHSLGCGGDKLDTFHCHGDLCPSCGARIALCGSHMAWNIKEATA